MKRFYIPFVALFSMAIAAPLIAQEYGDAMPSKKAVSIDTAIAKSKKYSGTPRAFSGRIVEVCQAKGCWIMLENNGKAARVKTQHKFFLPKDTTGTAVVYGTLKQVQLEDDQQKHYADESKLPVSKDEWQVIATSIRVIPQKED
jgi:hypothetical protein